MKPLSYVWRCRLLNYVVRSIRQSTTTLPRVHLSLCVEGKLERGRPFRTCKDTISESIRMLMMSMPESRPHACWTGHAKCKATWESMIDALGKNNKNQSSNDSNNSNRNRNQNSDPLPLLPYLSSREIAGMKTYPLHLPKECHHYVKQLFVC